MQSNYTSVSADVYLFRMGLGVQRGGGDCVYFVANKISKLETATVCLSCIRSWVVRRYRQKGCGSCVLPRLRHASCNYQIHTHTHPHACTHTENSSLFLSHTDVSIFWFLFDLS